ncbi:hypothetical protein [Flavobacterium sp. CLA17]|uniref:hypothetical protein n=1 Tax=Flavobacterium sp. CLA17 TaxID=2724135 RepID=UPI001490BEAB|nr:hypothetical protein [Flavobacterium sp. CLA17]QSB26512.1 hypothetical protein HAV12_019430 [Flavobacterium sp. CLA17]
MVKKVILSALLLCMVSCFYTRTDYGNIRFKPYRFTIKPNSNADAYKIIDTTKLYQLVDVIDTIYNERPYIRKNFFKFYANGRVGEFEVYYESDVKSLDPKKAKMAYYNYDGKTLTVQTYFEHPQGGGLLKYKLHKIDKEQLILTGYNQLRIYNILDLPREFLIYKPDW